LAFEDGLGVDPSQPREEEYVLSATGIVSKTLSVWIRRFGQYVILVGLVSVFIVFASVIILFAIFGSIGMLPTDPINYIFGLFVLPSTPDLTYFSIAIVFGVIAFIVNAILSGAAIKYSLDDYSGQNAEIGTSFSHAFGKIARIVTIQLIIAIIVSVVTGPSLVLMTRALEGIDLTDPMNPIIEPWAFEYMMMGSVLMLVGGIFILFFLVRFAPALAVVMDTELSAIDSLKRAWELTSGNFLHVLGAQILIGIVVGLLGMVVSVGTTMVMDPNPLLPQNPYSIIVQITLTSLLFSAPSLIYISVLYRDLLARGGPVESDLPEYVL